MVTRGMARGARGRHGKGIPIAAGARWEFRISAEIMTKREKCDPVGVGDS